MTRLHVEGNPFKHQDNYQLFANSVIDYFNALLQLNELVYSFILSAHNAHDVVNRHKQVQLLINWAQVIFGFDNPIRSNLEVLLSTLHNVQREVLNVADVSGAASKDSDNTEELTAWTWREAENYYDKIQETMNWLEGDDIRGTPGFGSAAPLSFLDNSLHKLESD